MKKSIMILAASLSFAALGACDSGAENAQENQADAVRDSAETQADAMENKADTLDTQVDGVDSAAENKMEDKAEMVREQGDAKADACAFAHWRALRESNPCFRRERASVGL